MADSFPRLKSTPATPIVLPPSMTGKAAEAIRTFTAEAMYGSVTAPLPVVAAILYQGAS